MPAELTRVQKEYVAFIDDFRRRNHVGPSLHDIREHVGRQSVSTIKHTVDILVDKGVIERTPGVHRSLRVAT
jgi:SOS-response transcriptional repressor LexA